MIKQLGKLPMHCSQDFKKTGQNNQIGYFDVKGWQHECFDY